MRNLVDGPPQRLRFAEVEPTTWAVKDDRSNLDNARKGATLDRQLPESMLHNFVRQSQHHFQLGLGESVLTFTCYHRRGQRVNKLIQ